MQNDTKPYRVLSFGGGVQSTAIAYLIENGEIPMIDAAIFADTGGEPEAVYEQIELTRKNISFEIVTVSQGDLGEDFLRGLRGEKARASAPPFMVLGVDKGHWGSIKTLMRMTREMRERPSGKGARLWRQCTRDYKIQPIRREIRRRLKIRGGGLGKVHMLLGISTDEADRMKNSDVAYIENQWPLIDLGMSRQDCLDYLKSINVPAPSKSSCYFCPYMSDDRLISTYENDRKEWDRLVEYDARLREDQAKMIGGGKINGTLYIHRSCKPISVDLIEDLRKKKDQGQGQMRLFGEECCGVCEE